MFGMLGSEHDDISTALPMDCWLRFVSATFSDCLEQHSEAIKCYWNEFIIIASRYKSTQIFSPIHISQRRIDYNMALPVRVIATSIVEVVSSAANRIFRAAYYARSSFPLNLAILSA